MKTPDTQEYTILGQKYAYATVSLLLGIGCFINLVGMEKAILAIIFGYLALRGQPAPALTARRVWAKVGIILGGLLLLIVPLAILLNLDRLRQFIEVLSRLSEGR
ncbi:MAG: hypothetical protein U0Z53_31375 [Blastocatellia bacterium]